MATMKLIHTEIEVETVEKIKKMADEATMPLATYMRLLLKQHIRTPLQISLSSPVPPPPAKAAKKHKAG